MIEAVLFDLDGTLVDSDQWWRDALTALIVERHGQPAAGTIAGLVGLATADAVATIGRRLGWPAADVGPDARWVEDRVADRYGGGVPWRDGALELVAAARAWPAKTGLVTSCTRAVVEAVRADPGCPEFDVVVSRDMVTRAKPSPDPYRKAAAELGHAPAVCVAVEDSTVGVTSALAAGYAIVVAVGEPAAGREASQCRHVAALTDVELADLDALLTKHAMAGG